MNEQRAIELCLKHRDPVGFEFLVRKFRGEAFFHAFALLGNNEDALDACQDAFTKAFISIPQLAELPRFYPWFYCILRNRCLNLLARRQTSDRYRPSLQAETGFVVDHACPGKLLEQQEEQARVQRALHSMKPEHREILSMKYIQNLRYEDIARVLRIPRGTVMSRLYHARTALRQCYENLDQVSTGSIPEKVK